MAANQKEPQGRGRLNWSAQIERMNHAEQHDLTHKMPGRADMRSASSIDGRSPPPSQHDSARERRARWSQTSGGPIAECAGRVRPSAARMAGEGSVNRAAAYVELQHTGHGKLLSQADMTALSGCGLRSPGPRPRHFPSPLETLQVCHEFRPELICPWGTSPIVSKTHCLARPPSHYGKASGLGGNGSATAPLPCFLERLLSEMRFPTGMWQTIR